MRLTLHTDYSLRLLIYLAMHEGPATVGEIAGFYAISRNHLTKVAQGLVAAGLVRSTRGRGGGIQLAHAPADVNIGQVVRLTENELGLVECLSGPNPGEDDCPLVPACVLKGVLSEAMRTFLKHLDGYTLADLLDPPARAHFTQLVAKAR